MQERMTERPVPYENGDGTINLPVFDEYFRTRSGEPVELIQDDEAFGSMFGLTFSALDEAALLHLLKGGAIKVHVEEFVFLLCLDRETLDKGLKLREDT